MDDKKVKQKYYAYLTVRLTPVTKEALDKAVETSNRSLNKEIEYRLRESLKKDGFKFPLA